MFGNWIVVNFTELAETMLAVSVALTSNWPMPLAALRAIVLPLSWLTVRIGEPGGIISC